jgi:hypothetical protein
LNIQEDCLAAVFFVWKKGEISFCSKNGKNETQVWSFVRKTAKMKHKSGLLFEKRQK